MTFNGILYKVVDEVADYYLQSPWSFKWFQYSDVWGDLEAIRLAANDEAVASDQCANGKVFSVGGDLAEMQRAVSADDIQSLVRIAELVNDISFAMKRLPSQLSWVWMRSCCWCSCQYGRGYRFLHCGRKNLASFKLWLGVGLAPDAGGLYLPDSGNWCDSGNPFGYDWRGSDCRRLWIMVLLYKGLWEAREARKNNGTVAEEAKTRFAEFLQSYERNGLERACSAVGMKYAELSYLWSLLLSLRTSRRCAYTEKRRPQFTGSKDL